MRRSRSILAGILLVGCFLPMSATVETAPGRGGRRAPVDLRIATGQRGGVYVAYGEGLAGVLRDHLPWARPRVLTTGASLDNLGLLASRRADLAFALSDSAAAAAWGRPPFTAPQPIRAIARLYDNYLHLVVRADAGIDSLPELRGRVIALGALGSGTELTASRLLLAAGIDPRRDLTVRRDSLEASAEAVRRREIDGFFFSGGLPTTTVRELAAEGRIRLVDLRVYAAPMVHDYGDFYVERTIPASTYGLPETGTVGASDYLIVRPDMDDDVAFALTSLLFDKREQLAAAHPEARRLNSRLGYSTYPVELHPGAVRYYRGLRP